MGVVNAGVYISIGVAVIFSRAPSSLLPPSQKETTVRYRVEMTATRTNTGTGQRVVETSQFSTAWQINSIKSTTRSWKVTVAPADLRPAIYMNWPWADPGDYELTSSRRRTTRDGLWTCKHIYIYIYLGQTRQIPSGVSELSTYPSYLSERLDREPCPLVLRGKCWGEKIINRFDRFTRGDWGEEELLFKVVTLLSFSVEEKEKQGKGGNYRLEVEVD